MSNLESGIQPQEEKGRDLHQEYVRLRREGPAKQAEFLLANVERNRSYVDKKLVVLLPFLEAQMHRANAERVRLATAAGESRILHDYYVEFSKLSERQRTLQGGFVLFLEKRFRADAKNFSYDNAVVLEHLLARANRFHAPIRLEHPQDYDEVPNPPFRSFRENYGEAARSQVEALEKVVANAEECSRMLSQIQEHFGFEILEEETVNEETVN